MIGEGSFVPPSNDKVGIVREGLAQIAGGALSANDVFYNPAQLNKKISTKEKIPADSKDDEPFVKKNLEKAGYELKILEPLAASGLRSIRYALELSDVVSLLVAGDLDSKAVRTIEENRERNGVSSDILRAVCSDANQLMHFAHYGGVEATKAFVLPATGTPVGTISVSLPASASSKSPTISYFDVIDVDPYGSVAGFLDAAVQSVADGGMLCLTSTDMTILCGNNPEVSYYKYGGTAVKARYLHEMSLRILINAVSVVAARHKRVVEPLLSCSVDFYVRCFVRIKTSPNSCKLLPSKSSLAFQCSACDAFKVCPLGIAIPKSSEVSKIENNTVNYKFKAPQMIEGCGSRCEECEGQSVWIAGPFYSGPLYSKSFVDECLSLCQKNAEESSSLTMIPKIRGLLTAIAEELWDVPLYYHLPSLVNRIKAEMMKTVQFKSALLHLGFKVSHFHRDPQAIKTDAPSTVVFDILRTWAQIHPPKNPEKYTILTKPILTPNIKFDFHSASLSKSLTISKWLPNPTPYWGPKARANSKRPASNHKDDQQKNKKK